jgi:cyclic pyranopterin phosphate synthase
MLKDTWGRTHTYLRVSLTDRCDLRCFYCMPEEQYDFAPAAHLMQSHEIEHLARLFVEQGIEKIRLTGGEPLVRKDAADILRRLGKLPVQLYMTTNGVRVHEFIEVFREVGLAGINLSLDTLRRDRFLSITRRDRFVQVRRNLDLLLAEDIPVKINTVVMRGVNEDEVKDFVALTNDLPIEVRFIEFMPFEGNRWSDDKVVTREEILALAGVPYSALPFQPEDTARRYAVPGYRGVFAIISTLTQPFCAGCNRLRLTADGKMKNCLFSKGEANLLQALRTGKDVLPQIIQNVLGKEKGLGGQLDRDYHRIDTDLLENRSMITIGG